ncbi:MAG: LysE family translocator [Desulfovibrionaceae bacterium]|jgi:threonine/homoserine/homoserine lactone efflux protein|nr:LysE family translocator [Desulfovibrionaceae bacterium]
MCGSGRRKECNVFDNLLPFLVFLLVMCATPGPGNLALLAIGQATGLRSAVPFLAGTVVGHTALDLCMALGLGQAFLASPELARGMQVVGTAYICWLGWKVLRMRPTEREAPRRFGFWEGVLLHPVSPKTWAMSSVAFSLLVDPSAPLAPQVAVFVLVIEFYVFFFHSVWCVAGARLLGLLRAPSVRTAVSVAAVALMVGTTVWATFGGRV